MLLFKMHFDNGFSIILNSYITQDLTCAGLPAAELCFVKGTSIGYVSYMYHCFKAEFVIELLRWNYVIVSDPYVLDFCYYFYLYSEHVF
jgi:hypothetical protein